MVTATFPQKPRQTGHRCPAQWLLGDIDPSWMEESTKTQIQTFCTEPLSSSRSASWVNTCNSRFVSSGCLEPNTQGQSFVKHFTRCYCECHYLFSVGSCPLGTEEYHLFNTSLLNMSYLLFAWFKIMRTQSMCVYQTQSLPSSACILEEGVN